MEAWVTLVSTPLDVIRSKSLFENVNVMTTISSLGRFVFAGTEATG